jgi:hypothetical protein
MSNPCTPAQYFQRVVLGDLVKNGKTAVALVEVLVKNIYGDLDLEEQRPFVAQDGGDVWIVEGSKNKDRSVEGPGKLVVLVNKADAKIESFMGDDVMFPVTEPSSRK